MIKSQVVVLRVFYDDDRGTKDDPSDWDWASLIDEPIKDSVEMLACGMVIEHPTTTEMQERSK